MARSGNPNPYLPQQFKPGQSGNPKGRPPKGYSISDMMKEMIGNDPKVKRKLGKVIMEKALSGDMVAIKTLWNYMDGLPQQKTDITTGGKPLPLLDYTSKEK